MTFIPVSWRLSSNHKTFSADMEFLYTIDLNVDRATRLTSCFVKRKKLDMNNGISLSRCRYGDSYFFYRSITNISEQTFAFAINVTLKMTFEKNIEENSEAVALSPEVLILLTSFLAVMIPLRACYTRIQCMMDWKNKCEVPMMENIQEDFTDPIVKIALLGFNVTYVAVEEDSSKEATSNHVDECLLSLQRNESDVAFMLYSMPTIFDNIKTGPVLDEVKIGMISAYDIYSGGAKNASALDSFNAFSNTSLLSFLAYSSCSTVSLEQHQ